MKFGAGVEEGIHIPFPELEGMERLVDVHLEPVSFRVTCAKTHLRRGFGDCFRVSRRKIVSSTSATTPAF